MKTFPLPRIPLRSLVERPRGLINRCRGARPGSNSIRRISSTDFARRCSEAAQESGARCLDVGVAANGYGDLFEPDLYQSIVAIDPNAKDTYRGYVPGRPVDRLPTESGRFGFVLCIGVLERIPEPRGFITELSRTLEPGGQVFLTAPLIIPDPSRPALPGRARVGLNYLLETAGLQIEDLIPIERSSSYAVIGKRTRQGDGQRRSDSTGARNRPV